jgi:BirA family transcriptional regulator, biotin operon repressor / biotin---[acetyl-CoA-carboxylase] ligase
LQENLYKIPANTKFIGKKIIYLPTCHSTNDIATGLLAQIEEGTVVITSNQTAGKGQRGNHWEAEAGANLTFSVVLRPIFLPLGKQFYFNMCVALAISEALLPLLGEQSMNLKLKWSNDIYFQNYKLGGVLIENTLENTYLKTSIVGIGINVNQEKFAYPQAISLKNILQKPMGLADVLESILTSLETKYLALRAGHYQALQQAYINSLYWYQETRTFQDANRQVFTGKIIGVEENGRLRVESSQKILVYDFKEIVFLS